MFGRNRNIRPRGFSYEPRFWDETKEEFDRRIAEAERRYHGTSEKEYKPSRTFNFRDKAASAAPRDSRFETTYSRVSTLRTLLLIVLLSSIVYLMYRLA